MLNVEYYIETPRYHPPIIIIVKSSKNNLAVAVYSYIIIFSWPFSFPDAMQPNRFCCVFFRTPPSQKPNVMWFCFNFLFWPYSTIFFAILAANVIVNIPSSATIYIPIPTTCSFNVYCYCCCCHLFINLFII